MHHLFIIGGRQQDKKNIEIATVHIDSVPSHGGVMEGAHSHWLEKLTYGYRSIGIITSQ